MREYKKIIYIIIFYQVKNLHKWFYINYQRYEEEKNIIISIGNEIEKNYDFINGTYDMYKDNKIYKENVPEWPKNGSIVEYENCIVVYL
jgi:hypothetical protein